MSRTSVSVRIEDAAGMLRLAQDFKGPYVLSVDGIKTIVGREHFLDFYIDVVVEDLCNLREIIEEGQTSCT